eukprot:gene19137-biopygen19403
MVPSSSVSGSDLQCCLTNELWNSSRSSPLSIPPKAQDRENQKILSMRERLGVPSVAPTRGRSRKYELMSWCAQIVGISGVQSFA